MSNIDGATTFKITNTKLYVPVVTLSTKDSTNYLKDLRGQCIRMNIKQKQNQNI